MIDNIYITEDLYSEIKNTVIKVFPNLIYDQKKFLVKLLTNIIKLILLKYNNHKSVLSVYNSYNLFRKLLMIDNNKNIKVILFLLLPFINNDSDTSKIYSFEQLSTKKKDDSDIKTEEVKYEFTNIQYNICDYKNELKERPLTEKDLLNNYHLLCYTIDKCFNKLHFNFTNVYPFFDSISIKYCPFYNKFVESKIEEYNFVDKFLTDNLFDIKNISKTINIDDIYNTLVNNVYLHCEEFHWLIETNEEDDYIKSLFFYLKELILKYFNINISTQLISWNNLDDNIRNNISIKYNILKDNILSNNEMKINIYLIIMFLISFNKYYKFIG